MEDLSIRLCVALLAGNPLFVDDYVSGRSSSVSMASTMGAGRSRFNLLPRPHRLDFGDVGPRTDAELRCVCWYVDPDLCIAPEVWRCIGVIAGRTGYRRRPLHFGTFATPVRRMISGVPPWNAPFPPNNGEGNG